jgi:hypothetical protein
MLDFVEKWEPYMVELDQCMFGLKDPESHRLYQKGTRLMTSNEFFGKFLGKRCDHSHKHEPIEGKTRVGGIWVNRSRCAQVYPRALVEGLLKAVRLQRNKDDHDVFAVEQLSGKNEGLLESVRRCHVNLGYPSRERFIHMLKTAGAHEKR